MCIFHYFNYYLPDFVTSVCLGFVFGFSFLDISFFFSLFYFNFLKLIFFLHLFLCLLFPLFFSPCSLSLMCINLLYLSLFNFAYLFLSFLSFISRPYTTRELTLGNINRENSHKGNHLNTRPGITQPPVAPCVDCLI